MSETFWAIQGKHGFYCGTWQRRSDAIKEHIEALFGLSRYDGHAGVMLSKEQLRKWTICKNKGDRVVKVKVTPI